MSVCPRIKAGGDIREKQASDKMVLLTLDSSAEGGNAQSARNVLIFHYGSCYKVSQDGFDHQKKTDNSRCETFLLGGEGFGFSAFNSIPGVFWYHRKTLPIRDSEEPNESKLTLSV